MSMRFAFYILLLPVAVFAEGPLTAEKNMQQKDSVVAIEPFSEPAINFSPVQPNNQPKQDPEKYDYRKDGLFIGLFHVGASLSQIDGDAYWGYNKIGFDAGVGTMVRV